MLSRIIEVLDVACGDLKRRALPSGILSHIRSATQHALQMGVRLPTEARFVPNDPTLAADDTVLNSSSSDFQTTIPKGFIVEVSSSGPRSFARPYYLDPRSARRCPDLHPKPSCDVRCREDYHYDLVFIGHRGHPPTSLSLPISDQAEGTRYRFFQELQRSDKTITNGRTLLVLNDAHFFSGQVTSAERLAHNSRVQYVESMANARFVLCPRGRGRNSIRFFEAIALGSIPIYIGNANTGFPLDWLVEWKDVVPMIFCGEIDQGFAIPKLISTISMSDEEHSARRRRVFE